MTDGISIEYVMEMIEDVRVRGHDAVSYKPLKAFVIETIRHSGPNTLMSCAGAIVARKEAMEKE